MNDQTKNEAGAVAGGIAHWLANGRIGSSSKTMAVIALGTTPKQINYPYVPKPKAAP